MNEWIENCVVIFFHKNLSNEKMRDSNKIIKWLLLRIPLPYSLGIVIVLAESNSTLPPSCEIVPTSDIGVTQASIPDARSLLDAWRLARDISKGGVWPLPQEIIYEVERPYRFLLDAHAIRFDHRDVRKYDECDILIEAENLYRNPNIAIKYRILIK